MDFLKLCHSHRPLGKSPYLSIRAVGNYFIALARKTEHRKLNTSPTIRLTLAITGK